MEAGLTLGGRGGSSIQQYTESKDQSHSYMTRFQYLYALRYSFINQIVYILSYIQEDSIEFGEEQYIEINRMMLVYTREGGVNSVLEGMISQAVREYIQRVREEEYCSDDEIHYEDEGNNFIKNISKNINLFFNKIIYSVNLIKDTNNSHKYSDENQVKDSINNKLQNEGRSQIGNQMREIGSLYKAKEDRLYNKPKKPVSSFFLFYQQKSKGLAQQHGEVVGSKIAQIVADAWNKLSFQQKQPYNDRATTDKQRYKQEMTKYIQEHSAQIEQIKKLKRMKNNKMKQLSRKLKQNGELIEERQDDLDSQIVNMKIKGISQKQMKAAQRKNYSHRPKAPVSSFFLFYQDQAKNIATQYGQTVGSRLARLASNVWKSMKPEQKQKYELAAKVQRERYHLQMIQYKIDYPNEIENRRKKISDNMKRALKAQTQSLKESSSGSDSLGNLSDEDSSNSSQSSNSYISSQSSSSSSDDQKKQEAQKSNTKMPKKRQKEDPIPHKPKGPICSFFQYYHANMKEFMKKQPGDTQKDAGSQFVRKASFKWKTLTDSQKQPYHQLAKIDRERYQKDMDYFKMNYPDQYQALKIFNKNKQLKNKRKRQAKLDLKQIDFEDDDILV